MNLEKQQRNEAVLTQFFETGVLPDAYSDIHRRELQRTMYTHRALEGLVLTTAKFISPAPFDKGTTHAITRMYGVLQHREQRLEINDLLKSVKLVKTVRNGSLEVEIEAGYIRPIRQRHRNGEELNSFRSDFSNTYHFPDIGEPTEATWRRVASEIVDVYRERPQFDGGGFSWFQNQTTTDTQEVVEQIAKRLHEKDEISVMLSPYLITVNAPRSLEVFVLSDPCEID